MNESAMWKLPMVWLVLSSAVQNVCADAHERTSRQTSTNETLMSFVEMVKEAGYLAEEHDVETEDGYVLRVHRMSNGQVPSYAGRKPVVILLHGVILSSMEWILIGPGKDLSYLLADAGYDVWALNTRGNNFCKRHTKMSPKQPAFWRFSWHEFGTYDVPAVIDYILAETGVEKVSLIGYSMGTSVSFVLLSARPEYNKKVNICVSLSPIAKFPKSPKGFLWSLIDSYGNSVLALLKSFGIHEINPRAYYPTRQIFSLCTQDQNAPLCAEILFLLFGRPSPTQFNVSSVPTVFKHFPTETSLDTLEHYRQVLKNKKFAQLDYGSVGNYARYKRNTPPEYPLHLITAPMMIYHGLNDIISTPEEVQFLKEQLPNVIGSKVVSDPKFSHVDFTMANNAKDLVYDDIIADLDRYK